MSSTLTQTQLGEAFGISSIAMGKKLVDLQLRDKNTKLATQYAINNKLGKNVTYNKSGQEITMCVWNENNIQYIKNQSSKDIKFCADMLIGKLKILKKIDEEDTGQKIDQIRFDYAYDDFLEIWKSFSKDINLLFIFMEKLEKENLIDFSERFDDMKDLKIIVRKTFLENKLKEKNIKDKKTKI